MKLAISAFRSDEQFCHIYIYIYILYIHRKKNLNMICLILYVCITYMWVSQAVGFHSLLFLLGARAN